MLRCVVRLVIKPILLKLNLTYTESEFIVFFKIHFLISCRFKFKSNSGIDF